MLPRVTSCGNIAPPTQARDPLCERHLLRPETFLSALAYVRPFCVGFCV